MGREFCLNVLRGRSEGGVPWVFCPDLGEVQPNGAQTAPLLTQEDRLVEANLSCLEAAPDGIELLVDREVVAECLGCELSWRPDGRPMVMIHPLQNTDDMMCRCVLPTRRSERIPMICSVMERVRRQTAGRTALLAPVCGPLTLASQMRGDRLWEDLRNKPAYVQELMDFCTEAAMRMVGIYLETGIDAIVVSDPMLARVDPQTISQQLSGSLQALFDYTRSLEAPVCLSVPGFSQDLTEALCGLSPDFFWTDCAAGLERARAAADGSHIGLGAVSSLSAIRGKPDNQAAVRGLLERLGERNLILCLRGTPYPDPQDRETMSLVRGALYQEG